MVSKRFPHIRIIVYIPVLPNPKNPRANFFYKSIGVLCGEMPISGIKGHQLPATLIGLDGKTIKRPLEWT
jgi:hypothetical protein